MAVLLGSRRHDTLRFSFAGNLIDFHKHSAKATNPFSSSLMRVSGMFSSATLDSSPPTASRNRSRKSASLCAVQITEMRVNEPTLLRLYTHLLCCSEVHLRIWLERLKNAGSVDMLEGYSAMSHQEVHEFLVSITEGRGGDFFL